MKIVKYALLCLSMVALRTDTLLACYVMLLTIWLTLEVKR